MPFVKGILRLGNEDAAMPLAMDSILWRSKTKTVEMETDQGECEPWALSMPVC